MKLIALLECEGHGPVYRGCVARGEAKLILDQKYHIEEIELPPYWEWHEPFYGTQKLAVCKDCADRQNRKEE